MLTVTLNPALDVSAEIAVVEPERKMRCTDVRFEPGGGGVNVARVAHRLGAKVIAAVFLAPADAPRYTAMLAAEGVTVEVLPCGGPLRESFSVLETSTKRQYRFVMPGAAMAATDLAGGIARIVTQCVAGELVVLSGSPPPGVTTEDLADVVAAMHRSGARVVVDTPGNSLAAVVAAGAALVKPGVHELSVSADETLTDHASIEAAARRLLGEGPLEAVLVSLGAGGALLVRRDVPSAWLHAPRVHAIGSIGAGDSLVAGVCVALDAGNDLLEAARWGVAAGTASTLAAGSSLCQAADVHRLLPLVVVTPTAA